MFGLLLLGLGGCAKPPEIVTPPVVEPVPPPEPEPEPAPEAEPRQEVGWSEVDGWLQDDPALAMDALLKSCRALRLPAKPCSCCAAPRIKSAQIPR